MPISIGAGTAIAAGVSALGAGGQAYAQGKTNKKTREWNEKMYGRQREDAMADWHMVNQYNSPEAQMARFKAAGLNPNLIYGGMDSAAAVRSSDTGSWNPQTPDFSGISKAAASGLEAYTDYTIQQEQIKTMQAQRDLLELEGILKTIEVSRDSRNDKIEKELMPVTIQNAYDKMWKLQQDLQFGWNEEYRKQDLHGHNLETVMNKAIASRTDAETAAAQLEKLKSEGVLNKLEIAMREKGLSYNDDLIYRLLVRVSDGKLSIADFVRGLWSNISR